MTHTLHPEIENLYKELIEYIYEVEETELLMGSTIRTILEKYLLPPSQHANIDKIMEDMEQYHITHYLSGRDVVLPCNIRQVLEKHLPPSQHLKDGTKQCTACL